MGCTTNQHYQPNANTMACSDDSAGDVFCGCHEYEESNTCKQCPIGKWMGYEKHRGNTCIDSVHVCVAAHAPTTIRVFA